MLRVSLLFIMFIIASSQNLIAAELINVMPVTNKILVVVFNEGHIDYFGEGQDRYNGNKIYYSRIGSEIKIIGKYSLYSPDDVSYSSPKNPVALGAKSKGDFFHNLYDNEYPSSLKKYWVYIELPEPLKEGNTYVLELDNLTNNVNKFEFEFNKFNLRSPVIHVNQIGFTPNAPKYAYLSQFMGDFNYGNHLKGALDLSEFKDKNFHVVDVNDNNIKFSGPITLQQSKEESDFDRSPDDFTSHNMTRTDVYECDFSGFSTPGEYKIVVDDMGASYIFEIKRDIFREPFYWTMRALFTQRCGIFREIEDGLIYPRCHHFGDGIKMRYYPNLEKHDKFDETGGIGEIDSVYGWYHDAGDFDGYSHHYRVPMGLLNLYDLKPENFADGDLMNRYKISESDQWYEEGKNGIPDLLDEARWLIDHYKRVKYRMIAKGYSDGGVGGYVGADAGASAGSWSDKRLLALKGGDITEVTYRYAALSAYLAVCLNKIQPGTEHEEADNWISEAIEAYTWAESNNPDNSSELKGAKLEASAALYRATGNTDYQNDFIDAKASTFSGDLWFNHLPWHHAAIIFGLIPDGFTGLDASVKESVRATIISHAENETVKTSNERGFRYGVDKNIRNMLGIFSAPKITLAAAAYEFTGEQKYLDACYNTAAYCLGGNQMNLSRISMIGDQYEMSVFHPDSWFMFDFNSNVYRNEVLPGYVLYDTHKNGDWHAGDGYNFVGDEDFSRSTAYPEINDFPDSEARFQNRNTIAGSEFTVHQTQIIAAFAYGYLCDEFENNYKPNKRPEISIDLQDSMQFSLDSTVVLTATASPDTRIVKYYYEWHFIGESREKENSFKFEWKLSDYKIRAANYKITAIAIDNKGMISRPSDNGDAVITINPVTSIKKNDNSMGNYKLFNNYPNPFNPETTIKYEVASLANVKIQIFDLLGREIKTLLDEVKNSGVYTIQWNGTDNSNNEVPSGVYFYTMNSGNYIAEKKLSLIR